MEKIKFGWSGIAYVKNMMSPIAQIFEKGRKKARSIGVRVGYIADREKKFGRSKSLHGTLNLYNKSPDDISMDFIVAGSEGKIEVMKQLLEIGTEVNVQESTGQSALMCASHNGQTEAVRLLLDKDALIDLQDKDGWPALMYASNNGQTETVKLLLERSARVDLQDKDGSSALMCACENGLTEIATLLLEKDAQIDLQDNEGQSALMRTSYYGQTEAAKLLLERGAQVNLQDNEGQSSLMYAYGHAEIIKMLLERGAQIDLQNNDGWSSLIRMSINGQTETVKLLLEKGAQVDLQDNDGSSALICATINGYNGIVMLLLEWGAQVDLQDKDGLSALMFGSIHGHTEIVKILLERGAQANLLSNDGWSALMYTSIHGQTETATLLLNKGAPIDLQQNDGSSALMCASNQGESELVKLLLEKGAQIDLKNTSGWSALLHASDSGHTETVKVLLERGAQVNLQDNDGQSALIHASIKGHTETAQLLLERGAQVDLQDNDGISALMAANNSGYVEIIKLLQAVGAQYYSVHLHGESVLTSATEITKLKKSPGIIFDPEIILQEKVMQKEVVLEGMGICLSVPEESLSSTEEPLTLTIHPCFSGPFELPDNCESASPAYLIKHSRRVEFQEDITVKIHHYASLEGEEDCDDMVFLSASSTPEFRGSRPVYVFKEIEGAKGIFKPGYQVGEIALRHFCIIKIGKRKRKRRSKSSRSKKSKGNTFYYSARLYRSLSQNLAIFCICLYDEVYTKHCDRVMQDNGKKWSVSAVVVQLTSEEVTLSVADGVGWNIIFDTEPTKILKRDIHLPKELHKAIPECPDYPPRLSIEFDPVQLDPTKERSNPIKLSVNGLDMERYFNIKVSTPETVKFVKDGDIEMESASPSSTAAATPPHSQLPSSSRTEPPNLLPSSWNQDTPTLSDTFRILYPIAHEWENLGTLLDISSDELSTIKYDNEGARNCLREMIKLWLKRVTVLPTWQSLANAVSVIDKKTASNMYKR